MRKKFNDLSDMFSKPAMYLLCTYVLCQSAVPVIEFTRKYPLHGYILGVLTHTTALDQLWEGGMWF